MLEYRSIPILSQCEAEPNDENYDEYRSPILDRRTPAIKRKFAISARGK
jgi:hypothetical protein